MTRTYDRNDFMRMITELLVHGETVAPDGEVITFDSPTL